MPGRLAPFGSRYERYHRSPDQLGVLGSENPDPRLPGKELVLGLIHDHFAAAVPLSLVRERRMIQGDLGPHPIVVAAYAGSHAFVYLRRSGDRRLDFEPTGDGRLRDLQSGSVWDPATGRALAGPLQGESLPRIRSRRAYWFVWAAFHPGSTLLNGESGSLHRPA